MSVKIGKQAWVTHVLKNEHLEAALILCESMKALLTTRHFVVIASKDVFFNSRIRGILEMAFDHVICLDEKMLIHEKCGVVELEDLVLMATFAMYNFTQCVYVSPMSMALKNTDAIFDLCDANKKAYSCGQNSDISICSVRPSRELFGRITEYIKQSGSSKITVALMDFFSTDHDPGTLEKKWRRKMTSDELKESLPSELFLVGLEQELGTSEMMVPFMNNMIWTWRNKIAVNIKLLLSNSNEQFSVYQPIPNNHRLDYNSLKHEPIAVIGMSCRYAKCNNLSEFWKLLIAGEDGVGILPPSRSRGPQNIIKTIDEEKVRAGFLKDPVDEVDSKFFGLSNIDAVYVDPQHRIMLEVAWEGLEDAGIDPEKLVGTNTAVFTAAWRNQYKDVLGTSQLKDFLRITVGNCISGMSGRISRLLQTNGPSHSIEAACASSMMAVHFGVKALQSRTTNLAIVGGVNLVINPHTPEVFGSLVSPDGRCKTFDAKADGYAIAEGCGVLILKRLSDAARDNDAIWGLIRGCGVTQDGDSRVVGAPTAKSQSLCMKQALEDASVSPEEVQYLETHGTGTAVGDPIETAAIATAYQSKHRINPLVIGTVKTNIGHTESCSGIAGIMKVILSIYHEIIPQHRNFETLNPAIDLDTIPAIIPLKPLQWEKGDQPRLAGVSSFGFTGTNAHAIIEEPPSLELPQFDVECERPFHVLKLSGKNEEALAMLAQKYTEMLLCEDNEQKLENICYTLNTGRSNFPHRSVVIAKSKSEMAAKLRKGAVVTGVAASSKDKICFLFTGQGSQYTGMAAKLYSTSIVFKTHFDFCSHFLLKNYQLDIKPILWNEEMSKDLNKTIFSQTGIFCVEYSLLKLWNSWGLKPDYVLGHSLGEFCAAVCAGILSIEDALQLVAERSISIDQLPLGKMLVVKAELNMVTQFSEEYCKISSCGKLDIAAVNTSDQTVVSGDSDIVGGFEAYLNEMKNTKCILIDSTHAFHSNHMDSILHTYGEVAEKIMKKNAESKLKCGYISATRGDVIREGDFNSQYWKDHCRRPVLYFDASRKAVELGCNIFVEIGPQPVLSAMTILNNDNDLLTCLPSLRKRKDEWTTMLETLSQLYVRGCSINWTEFDAFYSRKKEHYLPHYPFQHRSFWPDIISKQSEDIHPLVGFPFPNATSTKIFQCELNLKREAYLEDHVIGGYVLYPAAGYIEMCLAVAVTTMNAPETRLTLPCGTTIRIDDMEIDAPVSLSGLSPTQLQTTVGPKLVDGCYKHGINIYHLDESGKGKKWMPHVMATFDPLPHSFEVENKDTEDFLSAKSRVSNNFQSDIYNTTSSHGYQYGPSFRNLEKLWKLDNDTKLLAQGILPELAQNDDNYLFHPVLIDSMLQAVLFFFFHREKNEKFKAKLLLPLTFESFVWTSGKLDYNSNSAFYILVTEQQNGKATAVFRNAEGVRIATMYGVEFAHTTVKVLKALIREQEKQYGFTDEWYEVWMHRAGPSEHRFPLMNTKQARTTDVTTNPDIRCDLSPKQLLTYQLLNEYMSSTLLLTLYDCGWSPRVGDAFTLNDLVEQLGIIEIYEGYLEFLLDTVELDNDFLIKSDNLWRVINAPRYSANELREYLSSKNFTENLVQGTSCVALLKRVSRYFPKILMGEMKAVSVYFPTEISEDDPSSVASYYRSLEEDFGIDIPIKEYLKEELEHVFGNKNVCGNQVFKVRILEVGAGLGMGTKLLLDVLEEIGLDYEYTYTDISSSFFEGAAKKFVHFKEKMIFKKFNLEKDPLMQGFIPQYYDYCFAYEVVHATKDILESLLNIRSVMKPHGRLTLVETTRKNNAVTSIFGLFEGYWRFSDNHLREKHCSMPLEKWQSCFHDVGFDFMGSRSFHMEHNTIISSMVIPKHGMIKNPVAGTWVIFGLEEKMPFLQKIKVKLENCGRETIFINNNQRSNIEITRYHYQESYFHKVFDTLDNIEGVVYCWALDKSLKSQDNILQPFFYLCKQLRKVVQTGKQETRLRLVTLNDGFADFDDVTDFTHCQASTLCAVAKSLENEVPEMVVKMVDVPDQLWDDNRVEQIFMEMFNDGTSNQVAFLGSSKYVQTIMPKQHTGLEVNHEPLKYPSGTERFQLVLPEAREFEDLQFGELQPEILGQNEIEVQVKYAGLSSPDIMAVSKPNMNSETLNGIGFDFAGEVVSVGKGITKWKTGDLVCGMASGNKTFSSHVNIAEDLVMPIPKSMTFNEAVTIPMAYITAYHCLIDVAKINSSDIVLIHNASGGVGLAAIALCRHVGVKTVFCTAGYKRQRNYLTGAEGIEYVFNSRSTTYSDEILKITSGRGVDVILNSLTGPGYVEASLACMAEKGRFIEMSRLSTFSSELMESLRPDVHYTIVHILTLPLPQRISLFSIIDEFLNKGIVKSLPFVRFDSTLIRQALAHLQKAKHIGKVICAMPTFKRDTVTLKLEDFTPVFDARSTYLIAGGLGGIGFLVCQWMIEQGAKHIVLCGRSQPKPDVACKIETLNSYGANIVVAEVDVGNYQDCKHLIQNVIGDNESLPPLRGVMHAATVLVNGFLENQDWARFTHTFPSKVYGTWNLHELTDGLLLEHFVLFGSMMWMTCHVGLSNYSAGCLFQDRFAHYRHSIGLPATCINWGLWGEVGRVSEFNLPGFGCITKKEGLAVIERILRSPNTHCTVGKIESLSKISTQAPRVFQYFDPSAWKRDSETVEEQFCATSGGFWTELESIVEAEDKLEFVKNICRRIIRNLLKLDPIDILNDDMDFESLGIDSLMNLEIKNALQNVLGKKITVPGNLLRQCKQINTLAGAVLTLIEEVSPK